MRLLQHKCRTLPAASCAHSGFAPAEASGLMRRIQTGQSKVGRLDWGRRTNPLRGMGARGEVEITNRSSRPH
jgi:hypothetical protein